MIQPLFASALFDRTNANLWLVENDGAISSYANGAWLGSFDSSVYNLKLGEQALINDIPASSAPLDSQLAPLSLSGLGVASRVLGIDTGGNILQVDPAPGGYQQTLEVVIRVDADLLAGVKTLTLNAQVNGSDSIALLLDDNSEVVNGYFEASLFLVKKGEHILQVELLDNNNVTLATLERTYTITSNHPDGELRDSDLDGLPDVVEMALGLNPLQQDWKTDANHDGWNDFDQWLRSPTSNKNEIPFDSDLDGWSDFDENLRVTRPDDSVRALTTFDDTHPAPAIDTQQYRDTLLRFKQHPRAQRLYEVEYRITVSKQAGVDSLSWNASVSSHTVLGEPLFESAMLLTDEDLAWADVGAADISDSLKKTLFDAQLLQNQAAQLRVAASRIQRLDIVADETFTVDAGTINEHQAIQRWHYQTLIDSTADLIPARFVPTQTWSTAEEWKQLYVTFLQQNLVLEQTLELKLDNNLYVEALQLLLSVELELQGEDALADWSRMTASQQHILNQLQNDLSQRESRRSWFDVYSDLQSMLDVNGLTGTYSWLLGLQPAATDEVDVSQWLQQQALQSTASEMNQFRYLGRLALFDAGRLTLIAQPSLETGSNDSDGDGLSNLAEVEQPFVLATYPWAVDSDGDLVNDGVDSCATGEDSHCSTQPQLLISSSVSVNEPGAGQSQNLLVSFQLDKAYDQDVSFSYAVTASGTETATPDSDFAGLSGNLVIRAGDRVVLLSVPIFSDSDFSESTESFHIELSNVSNAVAAGSFVVSIVPVVAPSSNADLSALSLSAGELDQVFQPGQFSYSAAFAYLISSTTLTAVSADAGASITVNGATADSGSATDVIELSEGSNMIEVIVTSEDGVSMQTYQLTVTRDTLNNFAQQAYIKASNTDSIDEFGYSVALSDDTLVVGAVGESSDGSAQDDNSLSNAGAVYVFTRSAGVWSQQAYLKASNADAGDRFGYSVAIDGDTLAVSAFYEDSNGSGVNAEQDNSASASGAVYVFIRSAGIWSQQAYLKASNPDANDHFGTTLSLSGETLAVGAQDEDGNGSAESDNSMLSSGAVYVFTRAVGVWSQQAYLKASNADAGDRFGNSLAIDADTLAVAALSEKSASLGVNSDQSDNSINGAGAVYVFTRAAGNWTQQAYLKSSNTEAYDQFGFSVALSGETLAVGANNEDGNGLAQTDNTMANSGAVYVFTRAAGVWSQQSYIKALNVDAGDGFGQSLSLSADTLLVGALKEEGSASGVNGAVDNNSPTSGAAYLFVRSAGLWNQQAYIKASNSDDYDKFGSSVALSGDTLAISSRVEASGATGIDGNQADNSVNIAGAAYVFR
jgi:hypothetical protein